MDHLNARLQLRACIEEIEEEDSPYRRNTIYLRALAGAAKLLDEHEIAAQALRVLRGVPDTDPWQGFLTNLDPPHVVPESLKTAPSMTELEEAHPLYQEDAIIGRIRAYAESAPHIALCLGGRIDEARSAAADDLAQAEVGATLAVFGEFDAALRVANDPTLPASRKTGISLVVAIESFRRERPSEDILSELEPLEPDPWHRIALALGFAGREPWSGYPYPDW